MDYEQAAVMPVSHKHRVIFVHIPKTSGTYVENAFGMHEDVNTVGLQATRSNKPNGHLWGGGSQHWTIKTLSKKLGDLCNTYCTFTIVRDPYDRMVSEIAWLKGHKSWQSSDKMPRKIFEDAVRKIYVQHKRTGKYGNAHLMPQSDYLLIDGCLSVDKVFRFEDYEEIETFIRKNGIAVPKTKRMTTNRHPTEYYLTEEMEAMIYDMYAVDFELLGYERRLVA